MTDSTEDDAPARAPGWRGCGRRPGVVGRYDGLDGRSARRTRHPASEPLEPVRVWARSAVSRFETARGRMWAKAVPGIFAHEIALTELIADIDPGAAPPVVAADAGLGRILTDHVEGPLLTDVARTARVDRDAGPHGGAAARARRGPARHWSSPASRLRPVDRLARARSRVARRRSPPRARTAHPGCLPTRPRRCERANRTSWPRAERLRRARSRTALDHGDLTPGRGHRRGDGAGHSSIGRMGRSPIRSCPPPRSWPALMPAASRRRRRTTRSPTPISDRGSQRRGMSLDDGRDVLDARADRPPAPRGRAVRRASRCPGLADAADMDRRRPRSVALAVVSRTRIPDDVLEAAHARARARAARDWAEADRLKGEIEAAGWKVVDRGTDFALSTRQAARRCRRTAGSASARAASVPSRLDDPAVGLATVVLVADRRPHAPLDATTRRPRRDRPAGTSVVIVVDGRAPPGCRHSTRSSARPPSRTSTARRPRSSARASGSVPRRH